MKPKLILCLVLVLSGGLLLAVAFWQPHRISLSGSEDQIRASILKITPVGTPIEEVKSRIHAKLHPDTFYSDDKNGINVWPHGEAHNGKEIGCEIGSSGIPLLTSEDVSAYWVFDGKDCLADVLIHKNPDMP